MTGRKETIMKLMEQIMPEQFKKSRKRTEQYCEEHSREMAVGFLKVFQDGIERTKRMQETGEKGKIQYILYSHLYSSMCLHRYVIRMDVMDLEFYHDRNPVEGYWDVGSIYRLFEEDVEEIRNQVGLQVPRIRAYETDMIRYAYAPYYHSLAKAFIQAMFEEILTEESMLPKMGRWEEQVRILFGEYMGQADTLFLIKTKGETTDAVF